MCKLGFSKTTDGTSYQIALDMIKHQENVVAGNSTGLAWIDKNGEHLRKTIGKVLDFMAEYPDIPKTNMTLSHSRYATVGGVSMENQHPSGIMFNGSRIGYGIHNGGWKDYKAYEHHRNPNIKNKTDSALMFHIYSLILEKYNANNKIGRIRAMATLQNFLSKGENVVNQNFIFMFNDGQVIFCGDGLEIHPLTYKVEKNKIGIMSFGLPNSVSNRMIYSVDGFKIIKHNFDIYRGFELSRKKEEIVEISEQNTTQKSINDFKKIDKTKFKLHGMFNTSNSAKMYGEILKKKKQISYYRVLENKDGKFNLYINRRGKR